MGHTLPPHPFETVQDSHRDRHAICTQWTELNFLSLLAYYEIQVFLLQYQGTGEFVRIGL
jgi:hypothetical protein